MCACSWTTSALLLPRDTGAYDDPLTSCGGGESASSSRDEHQSVGATSNSMLMILFVLMERRLTRPVRGEPRPPGETRPPPGDTQSSKPPPRSHSKAPHDAVLVMRRSGLDGAVGLPETSLFL